MKHFLFLLLLAPFYLSAQNRGIIAGSLLDAGDAHAIAGATVSVKNDSNTVISGKQGDFLLDHLANGYYSIVIKIAGYTPVRIDSIHIRSERFDFNLGEIRLSRSALEMEMVTVYAEKPLYENKDGKIIFNAAESALSNAATATELLKQTPLVEVDGDGRILLRGKEVKILIDDKPVDMDARQLQDLLESMQGSMIEKIEVLTTPPPQYANERGGVINIVTKKGKVGINGRVNINYGTRGEAGINGNVSYRKKGMIVNLSSGFSYNAYTGNSYSNRQNIYADSSSFFNTLATNNSHNKRPTGRINLDYDLNKHNSFSFSFLYNTSRSKSETGTRYSSINRFDELYKLSYRHVASGSENASPSINFSYTWKGKDQREVFRLNAGANFNTNENDRDFYQQYLDPLTEISMADSFQQQHTKVKNHSVNVRLNYDKPLQKKLSLNLGVNYNYYMSHNRLATLFMKKPDYIFVENELLSNDLLFFQGVYGLRAALRYDIIPDFYVNAGLLEEFAQTDFDIKKSTGNYKHTYTSSLPFATLMKKWVSGYNFTLSYKRTIQRPGINQLNPSVDYSDPYNLRFGNPFLKPYYADNFDAIIGYWNKKYNANISFGYNKLRDIYSSIRLLQPDSKTIITWENISGREEYEVHGWFGLTLSKKIRTNLSGGYIYNVYSLHDRLVKQYRNGGSFNSSLNNNYQVNALLNATANFTFNRFSNPQGTARNSLSMNVGVQQKFFKKSLAVSVNIVDPFSQQRNNNIIYGNGYILESAAKTRSRNVRIALAYTFKKKGN